MITAAAAVLLFIGTAGAKKPTLDEMKATARATLTGDNKHGFFECNMKCNMYTQVNYRHMDCVYKYCDSIDAAYDNYDNPAVETTPFPCHERCPTAKISYESEHAPRIYYECAHRFCQGLPEHIATLDRYYSSVKL